MMTESAGQEDKDTSNHKDYYCPFCGMKLFRGKVATLKMVCSGCNKLVLIDNRKNPATPMKASDPY